MPATIVYAHGFRSSSRSRKAGQLGDFLRDNFPDIDYRTPDLSFRPATAVSQLHAACDGVDPAALTLVGSSLGGFYAIVLAEQLGCRAVLLNPSIRPFETLAKHLGPQTNLYTGEAFTFDLSHVSELKEMYVPRITRPARYLLVVEMGDELLDHHQTIVYCGGAQQIVIDGGNHDLLSFAAHMGEVVRFAVGN